MAVIQIGLCIIVNCHNMNYFFQNAINIPLLSRDKDTLDVSFELKVSNTGFIMAHGPLARYVKLLVAHAPGTFSPATEFKGSTHASWHVRHARAVMHVGIAYPLWRGKRSRTDIPGACATRNFTYLARGP